MATWTPAALSSEVCRLAGKCWRVVEAQHIVSTMALVDTIQEQQLLEQLIDASKPPVPPDCRRLHYLLATPFRYGAAHPAGSRFRRAGLTPGVFYASQTVATAVAEMAFRRLLFYAESPRTPWPANAGEYTAFAVRFRTDTGLDLTAPPFDRQRKRWSSSTDYSACQALADAARTAGVEAVRYESARAPGPGRRLVRRSPSEGGSLGEGGRNIALFTCKAFGSREPIERQVWRLHVGAPGVRAICDFPEQRLGFDHLAFAADPRIASLRWER